jgi:natural product precursor
MKISKIKISELSDNILPDGEMNKIRGGFTWDDFWDAVEKAWEMTTSGGSSTWTRNDCCSGYIWDGEVSYENLSGWVAEYALVRYGGDSGFWSAILKQWEPV